jgi:hypothetical protein
MGRYEDLVEQLRELPGAEDLAEEFEGFSGSKLRKAAERAPELERENGDLKAKLAAVENGPKIQQAFRNAGVDLDQLRPAEKSALAAYSVDDLTDDKVAAFISSNELPLIAGGASVNQDQAPPPAAAAVVSQAQRAPSANTPPAVITPTEAAKWSTESTMRFNDQFPEESEALRRGYEVTAPGFTAEFATAEEMAERGKSLG